MSIQVKLEIMHRHNGRTFKAGDKVSLPNSMALAMKRTGGCTFLQGQELTAERAKIRGKASKKADVRAAAKEKAAAKAAKGKGKRDAQ